MAEGHPSTTRNDTGGQAGQGSGGGHGAGPQRAQESETHQDAGPGVGRWGPDRREVRQMSGSEERERGSGRHRERCHKGTVAERAAAGLQRGGGGPRGPSPKTRCESAARARHGVSPPEASSTTAVPPQHPGRRLASPSAPGGPPSRGPHDRHRRHRRATAGPVETSLPRHLPTTTPHTPHAPAVPNPLPPPPRAQGDTREAHHPGTPARPRRPGGDTHTR